MSFLTLVQLRARTKVTSLIDEDDILIELWLDAANGYLESKNLDDCKPGYDSAMQLITQNIVESLFSNSSQQNILAANSPFRQEKFGSYSYTLKTGIDMLFGENRDDIEQSLTPMIAVLLRKYESNTEKFVSRSTNVFNDKPIIGFE